MKVLQEYNTFNPDNGSTGKIQVVNFHPSHNSAHAVRERNIDAIQRANASNLAIEQRKDKITTLVHRVTVSEFKDFANTNDMVRRTNWKIEEKFSQVDNGTRHVYFILSKLFADAKSKTGFKRFYNFVSINEFGDIIPNGEDGNETLGDCRARIMALNPDKPDQDNSEVNLFNVRNRAKPIVHLYGQPEKVVNPNVILREFVIMREIDGMFYKKGDFVPLDDLDIAQRFTKNGAFNQVAKMKADGVHGCKYIHVSRVGVSVDDLPKIDSIVNPTVFVPAMPSAVNSELNITGTATDSQSWSDYAPVDDQDAVTSSEGMTYTTDTHTEEVIASAAVVKPTPKAKRGKK